MTLFILTGPSGVGKTTIFERFQRDSLITGLECVITVTSRPKRSYEVDGVHFHFVPPRRLQDMHKRGELIEYSVNHGYQYGTPKSFINPERDSLVIFDIEAALHYRNMHPAVVIFLEPAGWSDVVARLEARGAPLSEIITRLLTGDREMRLKAEADYIVESFHGELDRMTAEVAAIVRKTRLSI